MRRQNQSVGVDGSLPKRRRRKWPYVLLALVALLFFSPQLTRFGFVRDTCAQIAAQGLNGELRIQKLELNWWGPLRAGGIELTDDLEQPVLAIAEVRADKGLWELLWNRQELGTLHIEAPILRLTHKEGRSNLERVLDKVVSADESGGSGSTALFLIRGGTVIFQNGEGRPVNTLADVTAAIQAKQDGFAADVSCRAEGNSAPGTISVTVDGDSTALATTVNCQGVPAETLLPLYARYELEGGVSGTIDGEVTVSSRQQTNAINVSYLRLVDVLATNPELLGDKGCRIERLAANGHVEIVDSQIHITKTRIESSLGDLTADVRLPLSSSDWAVVLATPGAHQLHGRAELNKIVAAFPGLIKLQENTVIDEGAVDFHVTRGESPTDAWRANVKAGGLLFRKEGQQYRWDAPGHVEFMARQNADGWRVESLGGQVAAATISGQGDQKEGQVQVQGDLQNVFNQLESVFDLGGWQLAGELDSQLRWRTLETGTLTANADVRAKQFLLVRPGWQPWHEPTVHLQAQCAGRRAEDNKIVVDHGHLIFKVVGDILDVKLARPTRDIQQEGLDLRYEVQGEMNSWLARLQPILPTPQIQASGTLYSSGQVVITGRSTQFTTEETNIRNLVVKQGPRTLTEPVVDMDLLAVVDVEQKSVAISKLVFSSHTLACSADSITANWNVPSGLQLEGVIGSKIDLSRAAKAVGLPGYELRGISDGAVRLTSVESGTLLNWTQTAKEFSVLQYPARNNVSSGGRLVALEANPAPETVWFEPAVSSTLQVVIDPSKPSVYAVEKCSLEGRQASLAVSGVIDVATVPRTQLNARLAVSDAQLAQFLRQQLGPTATVQLSAAPHFSVDGPLIASPTGQQAAPTAVSAVPPDTVAASWPPQELKAQAEVGWSAAHMYGFDLGPATFAAELKSGDVVLSPLQLAVSGGRGTLRPQVNLKSPQPHIVLPAEEILTNVAISQEMCQTWFKYVAPLFADATQTRGRFSLELKQPCQIPLQRWQAISTAGKLRVHSAQVGPGPLSQGVLGLVAQLRSVAEGNLSGQSANAWYDLPQQDIDFQVHQGRVYHRGLYVRVGDVIVQTEGSVGFDQTLDLLAHVPINDGWVERSQWLAGFKGQTLSIPVSGTLSSPKVDRDILKRLGKQAIQDSTNRLIDDQINRGLDRLFRSLNN